MSRPIIHLPLRRRWAVLPGALAVAMIVLGIVIALSPLFPSAVFAPLVALQSTIGGLLNAAGLQGPPFAIGVVCSLLGTTLLIMVLIRRRQSGLSPTSSSPPAGTLSGPAVIAARGSPATAPSSPLANEVPGGYSLADTTIYYDAENVALSQDRVPSFLAFVDKALKAGPRRSSCIPVSATNPSMR